MNKWLRYTILSVLFAFAGVLAIAFVTSFFEKVDRVPARQVLTYDRFIQKLEQDQIENVTLSVSRIALVQTKDGTKTTVDLLPYDKRLDTIISKNIKSNIYLRPKEDDINIGRLLIPLLSPIVLVAALVYLIRITLKAKSQ
jgi:ATP-dependent Zn protease